MPESIILNTVPNQQNYAMLECKTKKNAFRFLARQVCMALEAKIETSSW